MSEIDTDCTDDPVCPYCGKVYSDAWEVTFGHSEQTELECYAEDCGKLFDVTRDISVSYSTYQKDAEP